MAQKCRYCREPVPPSKRTRDHLVPKWALRSFPELRTWLASLQNRRINYAIACAPCNTRKSGMPAAIFAEVRLDAERFAQEKRRWQRIWHAFDQARKGRRGYMVLETGEDIEAVRKIALEEFMRPLPAHFPTGTKPITLRYAEGAGVVDFLKL